MGSVHDPTPLHKTRIYGHTVIFVELQNAPGMVHRRGEC